MYRAAIDILQDNNPGLVPKDIVTEETLLSSTVSHSYIAQFHAPYATCMLLIFKRMEQTWAALKT